MIMRINAGITDVVDTAQNSFLRYVWWIRREARNTAYFSTSTQFSKCVKHTRVRSTQQSETNWNVCASCDGRWKLWLNSHFVVKLASPAERTAPFLPLSESALENRSSGVVCMARERRCGANAESSQDVDAESRVGSCWSGDLLFLHRPRSLPLSKRR